MAQQLNERKIIEALTCVPTISGESNLVTTGAISGIIVKNGHVSFTIEIDPKDKENADQLRASAEKEH